MFNARKRILVPAAIIMSLALTPMLSGCGGLQGIVEQATGGKVDIGGANLPSDFPQEVPVPSGKVIFGGGLATDDGKAWNVTFKVASQDAMSDISAQLTAAGFTKQDAGDTPIDAAPAIFQKDPYGVVVFVTKGDDDGGFIANYTVTYTKPGS